MRARRLLLALALLVPATALAAGPSVSYELASEACYSGVRLLGLIHVGVLEAPVCTALGQGTLTAGPCGPASCQVTATARTTAAFDGLYTEAEAGHWVRARGSTLPVCTARLEGTLANPAPACEGTLTFEVDTDPGNCRFVDVLGGATAALAAGGPGGAVARVGAGFWDTFLVCHNDGDPYFLP